MIRNPVLRGFNPDPSITRVGNDYYLATSTFVWQPGIRLFHSTDLATWSLIGHGLQPEAHDLRGLASHQGIWAPCLTFSRSEGLFYLAYSLVHSTTADYFDVDNFLVTASGIHGPWSRPVYLNSIGFDPSFFHDDDGRHWLLTLEWDPRDGYEHPGAIVLEEFDADRMELCSGPSTRIYRGGTDRGCLEAPHLYRRNGFYYLMAAEGGTGYGHGVTLARSRDIAGPYQPAPVNPFLTSNPAPHFGRNDHDFLRPQLYNPYADLQKAGHGCLVDTPAGEWYVAHLCARPLEPDHRSVLGRETAIQNVEWTEDGWLRLTTGDTLARLLTPGLAGKAYSDQPIDHERLRDDFDGLAIDIRFSTLRRPLTDWASLSRHRGTLSIRGGEALTSRFDVSLVATQLQAFDAVAETRVSFAPHHFSHSAGLAVLYDDMNFAYLRLYSSESLRSTALGIVLVRAGTKHELLTDRVAVDTAEVVLQVRVRQGTLQFGWRMPNVASFHDIGPEIDATYMSDETTRGFTGTMIGMACVDSYRRNVLAHFDYFDLQSGSHLD